MINDEINNYKKYFSSKDKKMSAKKFNNFSKTCS